jgi:2-polyprenyl-3-methyl-5-hydroxy-6-metoxy-1,4-benzoquinol methylase
LREGTKIVVPIQESPYYQMVEQGSPGPVLDYHNVGMRRGYDGNCILLSSVLWTLSLAEIIKSQGFKPRRYAAWPLLAGRLVVDGLRRVSICAALGMKGIEVENSIQSKYRWWSQAFQVGGSWIDIAFPPDYAPRPGARQDCQKTWNVISPYLQVDGKHVLDMGCGPGFYCHRAIDAGAASVTGIDRDGSIAQTTNNKLSQNVVAQAEDVAWLCGYGKRIKFIVADLNQWQTEQQWDIVFALRAHYHMADPVRFLRLASQCAKETLVIQCNPTHRIEAGTVAFTKNVLGRLWGNIAEIQHGQTPILICKEKKV